MGNDSMQEDIKLKIVAGVQSSKNLHDYSMLAAENSQQSQQSNMLKYEPKNNTEAAKELLSNSLVEEVKR